MAEHISYTADKVDLVSIVICNYNYESCVGEAIISALAVDRPNVEIIFVDDGSTDVSRQVIEAFIPRGIVALLRPNKGPARAADEGYCRGRWILFLDADDMVDPSVVREAVAVMRPGWSLIQFQMRVIDGSGKAQEGLFPKYGDDVTPAAIRSWVSQADTYPTAPTSGNLLSREFLDKIFPLEEGMDRAVDSYFLSTAPFPGDVLTVKNPLVSF